MFEHLLPVAGQLFGIDDRKFDAIFAQKVGKRLLSISLPELRRSPSRQSRSKA
jgi:hypothetical protein